MIKCRMNQWTHIAFEFTEFKKPVSKVNVYIDGVMNVNNQIVPRYYKQVEVILCIDDQLMILIGGDIQTRSNYYGQLNTFLVHILNGMIMIRFVMLIL